jgi:hypothetical protein
MTVPTQVWITRIDLLLLALSSSLLASVALSYLIGVRAIRRYRASSDRGYVFLATGIILLSGVPIVTNVVLSSATPTPEWLVSTTVDLIRLAGLLAILGAIYE